MQLAERHIIKREHEYFAQIDALCFASKNLYNQANYRVRQEYIKQHKYLNYNVIQKQLQGEECYKALPAKVSQQVLMLLDKNWKSFFAANTAYHENPAKFHGRPKLPKYKDTADGRNLVIYTIQALSKPALKRGLIQPSKTRISIPTRVKEPAQVRIVPKLDHYVVEVICQRTHEELSQSKLMAAIDLGVNNLGAVTFNQPGIKPMLINGRPLKSINQFYHQHKAQLQSLLPEEQRTSRRIKRLATKRHYKIEYYLHQASSFLIDELVRIGVGTLIVGKNEAWKQSINLGKSNNQNFMGIPHAQFINQLEYKGRCSGIAVILTEESYTSRSSFLDLDPIPTYDANAPKPSFSGRRIQRGLYQAATGRRLNADINGSYNIMRKAVPNTFAEGIEGVVVRPVKVTLPK